MRKAWHRVGPFVAALALATAMATTTATAAVEEPGGDPISRCEGAALLEAKGFTDLAKAQYEKALDQAGTRECAADGLKALDDAHPDDPAITPSEAVDAVTSWVAETAWPWAAALVLLWIALLAYRLVVSRGGLRVVAAKVDEDLAAMVVAAANATGSGGRPPAKLVVGEQGTGLDEKTVASVTKLLGVPGGAPVDALLTLALWPWRFQRVRIAYSEAGGWAVLDITLHRLFADACRARLAVQLEGEDAKARQEVLSLVAGAWLATVLGSGEAGGPVAEEDGNAAIAHAFFRAGADLQDRAQPGHALACYAAMDRLTRADGTPDVLTPRRAPTAWVGARLNQMGMFKGQGRVAEALALANRTQDVPEALLADPERVAWYGEAPLVELRRRTRYLISVLYEDLMWADPEPGAPPRPTEPAHAAAVALEREIIALRQADPTSGLLRAMRLVHLCHTIRLAPHAVSEIAVRTILTDHLRDAVQEATEPPVFPAAYYDAACALALLPDPDDDRRREALRYLKLAVRASSQESRPRVRASALADPMLARLRPKGVASAEKFDKDLAAALGKDEKKKAA